MRKLLSFTLVLCLLLSTCLVMASCSKVSEDKMKKDPASVLSSAMQNTSAQFFKDTANINPVIAKTMQSGSLSISLEAELLEEFSVGKITETIYMNEKDKKIVSDTLVNYDGEDLTARLFVDENGIIVNSESIIGNGNSYGLFPATLAEKFTSSELAEIMGLTEAEDIAEVNEVLSTVADAYKKAFETDKKDSNELSNKLLATMEMTVSEQQIPTEGGKGIDCVVASYKFTNATCEAYLKLMMEEMNVTDEELSTSIDEAIADMKEEIDVDLTISVFVNAKKGNCEKMTVTGTFSEESMKKPAEIDASITFSATAITVSVDVTVDEEVTTVTADLTKEETKEGVTYQLTVKVKQSGTSVTFAEMTVDYIKSSGDFTITVELPETIEEDVVIKGKITSEKNIATISVNSVKYDNVEVELKLDITFNATAEIPKTPADVKDVVDLTAEDIEKLMEDFQNSKLGVLIFGYSGDAEMLPMAS